jgi:hypothetical protein
LDEFGHGLDFRPFQNKLCGHLVQRRFLMCRRKNKAVEPGASQGLAFSLVFQDTTVARDENPDYIIVPEVGNPLQVGRMAAVS